MSGAELLRPLDHGPDRGAPGQVTFS
jgi:hypothetical protein